MELERLEHCIEQGLGKTRFCNVWGQGFDASVMYELYAGKCHRDYRLSGTESVSVRESELAALVSAIAPMLALYRASDSGAVGNGLYRLIGSSASPRLPSVEDYARMLGLASARRGPKRPAAAFCGWIEREPFAGGDKAEQQAAVKGR